MNLRAWWSYRQGLDGRLSGADAATLLTETGWSRSVGGVGPYLTLKSRAGIGKAEADLAVSALDIHELPAARGCTYVVPKDDFGLALAAAAPYRELEMKTARKLGVTDEEIDVLCAAVVNALGSRVLSPDEIRDETGAASRSLGEEGKKKGLTTTLPLALGRLQASGQIRRIPIDGRLDQQRYKYAVWETNPRKGIDLSPDEISVELAKRFFKWIGPATVGEFQWFSALGAVAARNAMAAIDLEEIPDRRFLLMEQVEEFNDFTPPADPQFRFISSLDGLSLLRRDLKSMIDEADLSRSVFYEKDFTKLDGLADLPNHAIVDRGRLVGLWEYDTATASIVWLSFVDKCAPLLRAVEETEKFIRDELGDARSFSLDSPKSRVPAIDALRRGSH